MKRTLLIKNMVCSRCIMVVRNLLEEQSFKLYSLQLGEAVVDEHPKNDYQTFEWKLNALGFEYIKDVSQVLVEKVKYNLIQQLEKHKSSIVLSDLEQDLGKNYSSLSKIFSQSEGITIEKYLISLKIEKVKEEINLQQLNFSEIAYSLGYKNSSHLAKQFKNVTGMSMTAYKNSQTGKRKELDKII